MASALVWNCTASDGADVDYSYDLDDSADASLDDDGSIIDIGPRGGAGGAAGTSLNPLCGGGACVPDDVVGCQGGGAGLGGYGGAATELGCRLDFDCSGGECEASRSCGSVGAGAPGDPCLDSSQCGAGSGCSGGRCRSYCCLGTQASCADDEFCSAQPVAGAEGALAPVCKETENCPLSEPFPCPEGRTCACSGGLACVVVRSDGQTACATPGKGREGDACVGNEPGECAHGFVCSHAAGCLKLCSPLEVETGCKDDQACQTPADFPVDLGVCVNASGGAEVAK